MNDGYRPTNRLMRFALILGAVLTLISGTQLFVLTDHTDEFFAWTIAAGSSATVMGAFYWTACVLSFLSFLRQPWARARVGVPGVLLFLWATLAITLLHLDRLHFGAASTSSRVAAWAWLVVYVADPILVSVATFVQWRMPGADPPRTQPLAPLYRSSLAVSGAVCLVLGLAMLLAPALVIGVAPWPLTALTSRAIGSWVLALGGVLATMAWENDIDRIRPAAIACLVLPALLLIGMARYWKQFAWNASGWGYPLLIAAIAAIGVHGLASKRRSSNALAA